MARLLGNPDTYYGFDADDTRLQRVTHSARALSRILPSPEITREDIDRANEPIHDFINQLLNMTPHHPENPEGCIEGRYIDRRNTSLSGGVRPLITTTLDAQKQLVSITANNTANYEKTYHFSHFIDVSLEADNMTRHTIKEKLLGAKPKIQTAPLVEFPVREQLSVLAATSKALGYLVMGLRDGGQGIEFNLDRFYLERNVRSPHGNPYQVD